MSREKQIEEIEEMSRDLRITYDCAEYLMNSLGYRKQEWISVEDRLPEETGKYLVATKSGVVYQTKYYAGGKWGQKDKGKNITHWMPLPEAPKGGVE